MGSRLLLCTDLDRTLIANGRQEESAGARARFDALVSRPEITLVYVTGRHLELVQQAMREHLLPNPAFIIADVGTSVYQKNPEGGWKHIEAWQKEIARDWDGLRAMDLHELLQDLPALRLQENSKQNCYKLSYYFAAATNLETLARQARRRLAHARVNARVIGSYDDLLGIGLLDVVPQCASKLHALQALMENQDFPDNQTVFSGDSGNDLEVLVSSVPAVLVANAAADIKARARQFASQSGNSQRLYIASGGFLGMNGCYSAGILEGIAHYHPHTVEWMSVPSANARDMVMNNP